MSSKHHPSRRAFLKAAFAGAATTAWHHAWGASNPVAEAMTIVDTHTHFYDPTRPQGVPWPSKEDKFLYRSVLPKDYKALPTPQPVTGTIVIEASSWLEDNQWILDLAANDPFLIGFIGNLAIGTDGFTPHLERFAANRCFRGIRIGSDRSKRGIREDRFLRDLAMLARRDLVLDVLGGPSMLPDIAALATKAPELRIVIDHVANVRIDGKAPPADWIRGMQESAKAKNVFCKVSGLVEGTGRADGTAPTDPSFYKPVLDVVWETFGPDRLIYGSNWPVSERFASLATVQSIVHDYFRAKGDDTLSKLLSRNSQTVYRWRKP